ncbi:PhzF family phenazine biosynthesis protein [Euzebyella marina]|uniref:PhzF family phenazine biosynthesis protein n=1 Tax=Euzebyella marina TaxID=1761453 RepID=A0A3G2L2A6_9FLAO|nr:PhzF family phenazine biosynthesis protein [Euzebyella marina]AYN66372.1 PhzF family phenazine biosynthesis protein [Euzebyella marina]
MMKIKTFIIDAFTNSKFKGNPAGVCLLATEIDKSIMQSIANELNLSETAFILRKGSSDYNFFIRYFTPTVEIPFCGHATLAASTLVLNHLRQNNVSFSTENGLSLYAETKEDYIAMRFPLYDTVEIRPIPDLLEAFGIRDSLYVAFCKELKMLLVEVDSLNTLKSLAPDFSKAVATTNLLNNVIVTTKSSDEEYDFYSRCFCPWIGINEDPVTGAAHSILAKYWGKKLRKTTMKAFQASERGGYLHLNIIEDRTLEVKSRAQIVLEGQINI